MWELRRDKTLKLYEIFVMGQTAGWWVVLHFCKKLGIKYHQLEIENILFYYQEEVHGFKKKILQNQVRKQLVLGN